MHDDGDSDRATAIDIAGERLLADLAGALYWPAESVLVVADLHLEKGAAFAARGVPLPPYDTPDTLGAVERLVQRYRPEMVIALGDSFHRADSHDRLEAGQRERIRALTGAHRWIWIAGNHDPDPPEGLGGEWRGEMELGKLAFRHEPSGGACAGEISGHLHPVARIRARGRILRRRCFAVSAWRIVMPALGAYAGGLNILDPAFDAAFPGGRLGVLMLGDRRVHPVAASRLIADPACPPVRRAS